MTEAQADRIITDLSKATGQMNMSFIVKKTVKDMN